MSQLRVILSPGHGPSLIDTFGGFMKVFETPRRGLRKSHVL